MGVEIERKFLVDTEKWRKVTPDSSKTILQGYLTTGKHPVIRARVIDDEGYLTLKGKNEGIKRAEFEYKIPKSEAEELLSLFCPKYIHKIRHEISLDDHLWVVDEFISPQKGLLLAEIELSNEKEKISLPEWITKEVSNDPKYYNSNMV